MDTFDDDDENSDWVFNFESDHLALRGNRDYSKLLRTIALLEAQKIQINNDIEQLALSKNKYLHDPSGFVNDIFEDKFVSPQYRCIVSLPEVGKTNSVFDENDSESKSNMDIKVRGRIFDQTKPETFNQLWTCEEQRRLEQLLIEYPVEPVEMRRFAKIALALGNRTPQQVASRVQKFFKKLHSVGMPVPGRLPKNKKNIFPRSKHFYKNMYRRSTFFPAHDVPHHIPEDDMLNEEHGGSNSMFYLKSFTTTTTEKDNFETKNKLMYMLQMIREDKTLKSTDQFKNQDDKCENCTMLPCMQNKWICNTCCCYVNLCGDCILNQLMNKTYPHLNHDVLFNKEQF